ncbi:HNH endonuclease [Lysinibacillus sp. TE18511]
MQLVDYEVHSVSKHTGGRAYWAGGSVGRKGKMNRRIKNKLWRCFNGKNNMATCT